MAYRVYHDGLKRPRVLAILPMLRNVSGCAFYRITGPLAYLKQAGLPVTWAPWPHVRAMAVQKRGVSAFDVFVFQRSGAIDES